MCMWPKNKITRLCKRPTYDHFKSNDFQQYPTYQFNHLIGPKDILFEIVIAMKNIIYVVIKYVEDINILFKFSKIFLEKLAAIW
jgi:hypothetical protein